MTLFHADIRANWSTLNVIFSLLHRSLHVCPLWEYFCNHCHLPVKSRLYSTRFNLCNRRRHNFHFQCVISLNYLFYSSQGSLKHLKKLNMQTFLGVTILLSLTVFHNIVTATLPSVSDAMPLLGTKWTQCNHVCLFLPTDFRAEQNKLLVSVCDVYIILLWHVKADTKSSY